MIIPLRSDNSRTGSTFSGDIERILEKKFGGMRELLTQFIFLRTFIREKGRSASADFTTPTEPVYVSLLLQLSKRFFVANAMFAERPEVRILIPKFPALQTSNLPTANIHFAIPPYSTVTIQRASCSGRSLGRAIRD
jgi:hypothetical protein